MGRYDKEKEAMGLKPTSGTSAPKKESKYSKEREAIKTGVPMEPTKTYGYSQADRSEEKPYRPDEVVKVDKKKKPKNKSLGTIQLAGQDFEVADYSDAPSRDIPVVGKILQGLDKVSEFIMPATKIAAPLYTPMAGMSTINALTTGASTKFGLNASKLVESQLGQKALGMTNNILNTQGINLSGQALSKAANLAATEAVVGVPLAAGNALSHGEDMKEVAKQGLIGGVAGGLLGGALPFAGATLKSMTGKSTKPLTTPDEVLQQPVQFEFPNNDLKSFADEAKGFNTVEEFKSHVDKQYGLDLFDLANKKQTFNPDVAYNKEINDIRLDLLLGKEAPKQYKAIANNVIVSFVDKIPNAPTGAKAAFIADANNPKIYVKKSLRNNITEFEKVLTHEIEHALNFNGNPNMFKPTNILDENGILKNDAYKKDPTEAVADANTLKRTQSNKHFKDIEDFYNKATNKPEQPTASKYAKELEAIQQAGTTAPKAEPTPSRYAEELEAIKVSPLRKQTLQGEVDELKFADTVKRSENTPDELTTAMKEKPMVGARTTDVLNRKQADELITKHGKEGLYAELISKKFSLSPAESVAAQKLAKEYASKGGKENVAKSIALIFKTAREGREMGQAIQALGMWNKLDETGALLMGQRQLNRGIKDTADWKPLTPEQAEPLQEVAERIGQAQETKSLADEVLSIVTNKKAGEALTDAEKATIKSFQDQVKDIDSKVKGFLPKQQGKAQETIKKIKEIAPKERTRDQVVSFLDAKADLARKRLEKGRNVGIVADLNNPVTDYAIIGASHLAKGIRNYADYAEMLVKDFGDSVKPHLKEAYNKSVNMFRREHGLPTVEDLDRVVNKAVKAKALDKETADSLKAIASDIGFYSDKNLKREATQDLQRALKELGSSTLGEKLSTLQTGAQLLNAVTIGRNVIGNTAQMATEKLNKMIAVPVDWGFSKLTGERTIMFNPHNQEKMLANFMMGAKSGWEGVSPTGTLSSYDVRPDVFGKKNPLRYTTKGLGATLQSFDNVAYLQAYGDVVATFGEQLGKAQGLTKAQIKEQMPKLIEQLDDRIHEMADQAGLYATFQDETLLSKAADITKKGLNKITDYPMEKLVDMGVLPKKFSTQGFGLGDIVLKYARTPANLVMRGIDYSPLGFLRATMELAPLVFNKSKFNQFEATRALSRAITGTLGLTGMGYILADAGVLTGSYSRDKDLRSIEEQSGQGSYKVNWSALGRFITSGLDKKAAKFQKGDRMMDYQWLQPTAIALAIGVNANKSFKEAEPDASTVDILSRAILGGLSTVLENPMVQGLSGVIDAGTEIIKNQDTSQAKRIIKGVPTTFIPTVLGQARTATDNKQRETRDEKILNEMFNLIKNKLPGASKTLPIAYDSLGNERERLQGGKSNTVGQYLKSFFSPAKLTKYEVSPDAKLVLDLLEESKDLKILPRMADRGLEVNDSVTGESRRVILTGKQYSDLQKSVGKQTTDMLREYEYFLADPNVTIEEKSAAMSKILTHVGQVARNELRDSMGYQQKQVR